MVTFKRFLPIFGVVLTIGVAVTYSDLSVAATTSEVQKVLMQPALKSLSPTHSSILSSAKAGDRVVAVGEQGVVLISDDRGLTFRQAKSVPVRTQLNTVYFKDAAVGWAAGQGGTILKTQDGGESWQLVRSDLDSDRPIFTIYFTDENVGWAAGLWSLLLKTTDGGKNWVQVDLPNLPSGRKPDLNLFKIIPAKNNDGIYIAAERGTILSTRDEGKTWKYIETGYSGTFWTGVVASSGSLFVGGLRGAVYLSKDEGESWKRIESDTKDSVVTLISDKDYVYGAGLNGLLLKMNDEGQGLKVTYEPSRIALTSLQVEPDGRLIRFGASGVVD